jgi:hypothetical protein
MQGCASFVECIHVYHVAKVQRTNIPNEKATSLCFSARVLLHFHFPVAQVKLQYQCTATAAHAHGRVGSFKLLINKQLLN